MAVSESTSFFAVRAERRAGVARLHASGELDLSTGPLLEDAFAAIEEIHPDTIIVDFKDLTFMDSTGLHALARAHDRASHDHRIVVLLDSPEGVRRVVELSGLDRLMEAPITPDPPGSSEEENSDWSPILISGHAGR